MALGQCIFSSHIQNRTSSGLVVNAIDLHKLGLDTNRTKTGISDDSTRKDESAATIQKSLTKSYARTHMGNAPSTKASTVLVVLLF